MFYMVGIYKHKYPERHDRVDVILLTSGYLHLALILINIISLWEKLLIKFI